MNGKLYIVATPIGNLGDMSPRGIDTLKSVDFIAAEDTRVTLKLLNHFDIKKPMVSYYEHNRAQSGDKIIERILAGETCALVSDAGMPAISDPGCDLARLCWENRIEVISVPGASAIICALAVSGIDTGRFCFEGFLSTANKSRMEHLNSLKTETRTMVFYEAPHKLLATLVDMQNTFGDDRRIALCRELTKIHEQTAHFTLKSAVEFYEEHIPKGEYVIVIEGAEIEERDMTEEALSMVKRLVSEGESLKNACREASNATKVPKNVLYKLALEREI